jgi:menaquinone-dependent protoporphyrinogen oxidase
MKGQTRRKFIKDSAQKTGAGIGVVTLSQNLLSTPAARAGNHPFPSSNYGVKNKTGQKVLITYSSQFGTTAEIAEFIGKVLCQSGATVEIKWVKSVEDLNNYDAVIIGSPIQYDRWIPVATEFVRANQIILSKLPVAYFFTCLELSQQTEKTKRKAIAYSEKLYALTPQVQPVSVGRFAGVLDYSKMSFFFRLIAKGIFAIMGVSEGDYRNWDAIRQWAQNVHAKLQVNQSL